MRNDILMILFIIMKITKCQILIPLWDLTQFTLFKSHAQLNKTVKVQGSDRGNLLTQESEPKQYVDKTTMLQHILHHHDINSQQLYILLFQWQSP